MFKEKLNTFLMVDENLLSFSLLLFQSVSENKKQKEEINISEVISILKTNTNFSIIYRYLCHIS